MTPDRPARDRAADLHRSFLHFLPAALLEPRRPLLAIAVGWATAFFPSIALGAVIAVLLPATAQPQFEIDGATAVALIVIAAPLLETMIMAAVLVVLQWLVRPSLAVLLSALGWGIAHSLAAPAWGLVIWWPFLIFSTLFVTWRRRSLAAALLVPASTHALQNLLPALLLLYEVG